MDYIENVALLILASESYFIHTQMQQVQEDNATTFQVSAEKAFGGAVESERPVGGNDDGGGERLNGNYLSLAHHRCFQETFGLAITSHMPHGLIR